MAENTPSTVGKLNVHDLLNAVIMFIGTAILTYLQSKIPDYNLPPYVQIPLSSTVTYLLKNVFTDNIKIAQKVLIKATKNADTEEEEKAIIHPVLNASSLTTTTEIKKNN